jgi:hypothetical protein
MTFKLYSYTTGEPVDMVELHVVAKAYRAAWRLVHVREPEQCHLLPGLDLVIDFGDTDPIAPTYGAIGTEVAAVGCQGAGGA